MLNSRGVYGPEMFVSEQLLGKQWWKCQTL